MQEFGLADYMAQLDADHDDYLKDNQVNRALTAGKEQAPFK